MMVTTGFLRDNFFTHSTTFLYTVVVVVYVHTHITRRYNFFTEKVIFTHD